MKGLKCFRLTRFLSMRYCFFLVFALFCSFFCSQLSVSSASADVDDRRGVIEVNSDYSWFGFQSADPNALSSDYLCSSDWLPVGSSHLCDSPSKYFNVGLSNISSSALIELNDYSTSGSGLELSGIITLGGGFRTSSFFRPLNSYAGIFDSCFTLITDSPVTDHIFDIGISSVSDFGNYNADSVVVNNISCVLPDYSPPSYFGSSVSPVYKVFFNATFNRKFSPGKYRLSWRLNGNNATNGGVGQKFGGFWSPLGPSGSLSFTSSVNSSVIVGDPIGGSGGGGGGGGDTPSTGSLNLSGHSSYYWFGFSNYNAALADHYDYFTDWKLVNTVFNSRNFPGSGVQRWAVKNVSHSASGITISSNMVDSNGYASLSGYVDLVNIFDEAYRTDSGYVVKNIDSSYRLFDASAFSLGFGDTPNVSYNNGQSVCSSVTMQNLSNPINSGYGSVVRYRLSFSGCRVKASAGTNKYFSWRLNGNNATNGGKGSYFAPYIYKTNGTSQWLKYYGSPSEYKLTFTTYSGGGTTTPGHPTDPDNPDNPSNPSAPDYSDNLNDINNSLNDVNNSINNQTQQDKEQYDSEKKEENDRENAGKEDADTAQGIFNFNILNPFAPLFEMFNPGGCINIPTLSDWLHTEDKQICPWFPAKVVNIVTPVLSISSMMLLFGFVVKWLNGSGFGYVFNG